MLDWPVSGKLRLAAATAALALLLSYAYAPLAGAGFLRADFPILAEAAELARPFDRSTTGDPIAEGWAIVRQTEGHPLEPLSLVATTWFWADDGVWYPTASTALRFENLLLLGIAALGLRAFVRRLLLPWTGSDQARAAGAAGAVIFLLHPLCLAAVADAASRGHLIAFALGTPAAAAFLRGRQDRRYRSTVVAGVLTLACGLASDLALWLPIALAAAEYLSAHRYRPTHVRVRTAMTTLVVFGACVAMDIALVSWMAGGLRAPESVSALVDLSRGESGRQALAFFVEKLGVLVLPVNARGIGLVGYGLAGGLVLVAMQPALLAARSAPRLWGFILALWCVALVVAALHAIQLRVHPRDLSHASVLFPSAAVMSVGFGIAATALSGVRRQLLPWGLAFGFAVLSHANARPLQRAAHEIESLQSDLQAARELFGRDARLLVLDPPESVTSSGTRETALPWLLHSSFSGDRTDDGSSWVRGVGRRAFLTFVRQREFRELRHEPLVLLHGGGPGVRRETYLVPAPEPSGGPRSWYLQGRSPRLDLDPLQTRVLRVRVEAAGDDSPPAVGWRATPGAAIEGAAEGAWITGGGETVAVFDLGASLEWLCAGRIRLLWPERGWESIVEANLLDEVPDLGVPLVPRIDGDDWLLELPGGEVFEQTKGRGEWIVGLLDLSGLGHEELRAFEQADGRLRVPNAAARVARTLRGGGELVAWSLDYRIDGVTIARASGRRQGRDGTLEEGR